MKKYRRKGIQKEQADGILGLIYLTQVALFVKQSPIHPAPQS